MLLTNLKTIWPFIWPKQKSQEKWRIVMTLVAVIVTITLNITTPFILKMIVDTYTRVNSNPNVTFILLFSMYGFIWATARCMEKVREMLFFRPIQTAITNHSLTVFNHIHAQCLGFHNDRETGRVSGAIQRAQLAIAMIVTNIIFRIAPVFVEALIVFFLLWYHTSISISLILVATIILYFIMNYFLIQIYKKADDAYQSLDMFVNRRVVDSFLNTENIKFLNAASYETAIADKLFVDREKAILKVFWSGTLSTTVQASLLGLSLIVISYIVAKDILTGTHTIGEYVLINGYLIMLYNPIDAITGFIRNTVGFSGDLSHSTKLLQQSNTIEEKEHASDIQIEHAAIEFNHVNFKYPATENLILQNLSLDIPAKSTIAIVGPSGSGKSTLSKLLFRFYDINAGEIKIDNQNIADVKKQSLRSNISFVPQDIVLLNQSIKDNICYGQQNVSDYEIDEILHRVHLNEFVQQLPKGLDTLVGERGIKLSGGEKQRIGIARALLKKPKILIFDEATSSLDTKTEKIIQNNIYEVSNEIATIIIAHRLSTIKDADMIVVLNNGKVSETGTHKELLKNEGLYANLWRQQDDK